MSNVLAELCVGEAKEVTVGRETDIITCIRYVRSILQSCMGLLALSQLAYLMLMSMCASLLCMLLNTCANHVAQ